VFQVVIIFRPRSLECSSQHQSASGQFIFHVIMPPHRHHPVTPLPLFLSLAKSHTLMWATPHSCHSAPELPRLSYISISHHFLSFEASGSLDHPLRAPPLPGPHRPQPQPPHLSRHCRRHPSRKRLGARGWGRWMVGLGRTNWEGKLARQSLAKRQECRQQWQL